MENLSRQAMAMLGINPKANTKTVKKVHHKTAACNFDRDRDLENFKYDVEHSGMKKQDIAKKYGISPTMVSDLIFREMNEYYLRIRQEKNERRKKILDMRATMKEDGTYYTYKEISVKYGVPISTVNEICNGVYGKYVPKRNCR